MIDHLSHIVTNKNIKQKIVKYFSGITTSKSHIKNIDELFSVEFPLIIISVIAIQGLISTSQMITTSQNTSTFNAIAVATKYLSDINNNSTNYDYKNNLTIISDIRYLWILEPLWYRDLNYKQYWDRTPVKTEKLRWILDDTLKIWVETDGDGYGKQVVGAMQLIYNHTVPISEFSGEETVTENRVPSKIQIRTNL